MLPAGNPHPYNPHLSSARVLGWTYTMQVLHNLLQRQVKKQMI